MQRILVALAIGLFIVSAGCAPVLRVHRTSDPENPEPLKGVPFRAKIPSYVQRSVYQESWYEVTVASQQTQVDRVVASPGEKKVQAEASPTEVVLRQVSLNYEGLKQIRRARDRFIADASSTALTTLLAEVDRIAQDANLAAPAPDVSLEDRHAVLTANTVTTEWIADEAETYYLNGRLPWFGSANVETELSADGTLSKASGQSESKAAEIFSSVIPLKEFASVKLKLTPTEQKAEEKVLLLWTGVEPSPLPAQQISLSAEEKGYVYTLAKHLSAKPKATPAALLMKDGHEFTRTTLGALVPPEPEESDKKKGEDDKQDE